MQIPLRNVLVLRLHSVDKLYPRNEGVAVSDLVAFPITRRLFLGLLPGINTRVSVFLKIQLFRTACGGR